MHSLSKFVTTYASRIVCSVIDADTRGHWCKQQCVVVKYIDTEMPYVDAKVASVLCLDGHIQYKLLENSGVSDEWLYEHVVTNILHLYPVSQKSFQDIGPDVVMGLLGCQCMQDCTYTSK